MSGPERQPRSGRRFAALFAAGHRGAVTAYAPLTAAVVTRTAMLAHMTGHVVFTLAEVLGGLPV